MFDIRISIQATPMTPATWRRARSILAEAIDAPPEERGALIARRCEDDASLQREIESMLRGDSVIYRGAVPPADGNDDQVAATRVEPTGDTPSVAGSAEPAPRAWGEFLLLQELGRGGFGVVHRAWDPALQRDVALKLIDVRRLSHARREMLLREGQMLARLRHPNVVTVHSVHRRGPDIGLVMEYLRGVTLSDLIAREGPLPPGQVAQIGATLCHALAQVHRSGLVHRDIKPANVMRERDGRIVLMDFGAGHDVVGDTVEASIVIGTPLFMSPEVLAGRAAIPASDVYSLGVLLYYLLTATYPPREGANTHDPTSDDVERSLNTVRPGLPPALVEAVSTALAPDRHRRPKLGPLRRLLESAVTSGRKRHSLRDPLPTRLRADGRQSGATPRTLIGPALGMMTAGLLVTSLVGAVTTLEFNYVLGRSGVFDQESVLSYPYWGARALVTPALTVGLIFASLNALGLLARSAVRLGLVPSGLVLYRLNAWRPRLRALGLYEPRTRCQIACVVGLIALAGILAAFAPLLDGYASRLDTAPLQDIAVLTGPYATAHMTFRASLTVLLFFLGTQVLYVLRTVPFARISTLFSPLASLLALLLVALMLQATPWRTFWHSRFRMADWNGQRCFVVAAHGEERLLHCPNASAPRNHIVSISDPGLTITAREELLLTAYESLGTLGQPPVN